MNSARTARSAFTLIELLVVIAIITLLIALLIPAVQKTRAAADKLRCGNNLKQIGLAVHQYSNDYSVFPSVYYAPGVTGDGWSVQAKLLPYLEQENLQRLIDYTQSYRVQPHVTQQRIGTYICPADSNIKPRIDGSLTWYPINYAANMGTWFVYHHGSGFAGEGVFPPSNKYQHGHVGFRDLADGTSYTLGFSEAKSYTPYLRESGNPNGLNVPPPESPLVIAGFGGEFKVDSGHTEWTDGRVHQTGFTTTFPPNTFVPHVVNGITYDIDFNSTREGRNLNNYSYAAVTARSYHPGLVNALMMDGSVRGYYNTIALEVWRGLGTRKGGEVTPEE